MTGIGRKLKAGLESYTNFLRKWKKHPFPHPDPDSASIPAETLHPAPVNQYEAAKCQQRQRGRLGNQFKTNRIFSRTRQLISGKVSIDAQRVPALHKETGIQKMAQSHQQQKQKRQLSARQ